MVHPQKRVFIKKVLECTICRICEFKKDLVAFNTRPGSIYVHLDQLLFDLKYDPSVIEIPVPRYFREDDRIPVELQWHEKVEKADAKKKKGKKKKAKKKKKSDDDDEEKKKEPMRLEEKNQLMDNLFNQLLGQQIQRLRLCKTLSLLILIFFRPFVSFKRTIEVDKVDSES